MSMFRIIKKLFRGNKAGSLGDSNTHIVDLADDATTAPAPSQTKTHLALVTPNILSIRSSLLSIPLSDQDNSGFNESSASCIVLISSKTRLGQGKDWALLQGVQIIGDIENTVLLRRVNNPVSEVPQSVLLIKSDPYEDDVFSLRAGGLEDFRDKKSLSKEIFDINVMYEKHLSYPNDTIQDYLFCTSLLMIGAASIAVCVFFTGEYILYATHLFSKTLMQPLLSSALSPLLGEIRFGASSYEVIYGTKSGYAPTKVSAAPSPSLSYSLTPSETLEAVSQDDPGRALMSARDERHFNVLDFTPPDLQLFALSLQNVTGLLITLFKLRWGNVTFSMDKCNALEHHVHEMLSGAMDQWGRKMINSATVVCDLISNAGRFHSEDQMAFDCVEDSLLLIPPVRGACETLPRPIGLNTTSNAQLTLIFSVNGTVLNINDVIFSRTSEITQTFLPLSTATDSITRVALQRRTPSDAHTKNSNSPSLTNEFSPDISHFTKGTWSTSLTMIFSNSASTISDTNTKNSNSHSLTNELSHDVSHFTKSTWSTSLTMIFSNSASEGTPSDSMSKAMSKNVILYPIGNCTFYIDWVNANNNTLWPLLGAGACNRTQLIIRDQNINPLNAGVLGVALQQMQNLLGLGFSNCSIDDSTINILAPFISTSKNLTGLGFLQNKIGPSGAGIIASFIGNFTSLRTLSINTNQIGDEGAAALGNALRDFISLSVLNFGDNNITATGCAELLGEIHLHNPGATLYC